MGDAAERLDWALADAPVVKLRLIRSLAPTNLDLEDQALLDLLEVTFVRRWVDALQHSKSEEAASTVQRLWRQTSSAWRTFSPRLTRLLHGLGVVDEPDDHEAILDAVEAVLPRALDYLPHLSATARVYARAFLSFIALHVRDPAVVAKTESLLSGMWPVDPKFEAYMSLLQALAIAGLEDGVPHEVTNALATAFWASVRALVEHDEAARGQLDAALRDAAREARLAARRDAPSVPSDIPPHPEFVLTRLRKQASESPSMWESVPSDASKNLDKYLYGR